MLQVGISLNSKWLHSSLELYKLPLIHPFPHRWWQATMQGLRTGSLVKAHKVDKRSWGSNRQSCDQWKTCSLIQAVSLRNTALRHNLKKELNVSKNGFQTVSLFSGIMTEADTVSSSRFSCNKSSLMASGYLGLCLFSLMNTKTRIHADKRCFQCRIICSGLIYGGDRKLNAGIYCSFWAHTVPYIPPNDRQ